MNSIEFYTFEDEVWFRTSDGKNEQLTEDSREVIYFMINQTKELYPDAHRMEKTVKLPPEKRRKMTP